MENERKKIKNKINKEKKERKNQKRTKQDDRISHFLSYSLVEEAQKPF